MYKTFVRPQLEHATAIWNPHHKCEIELIENVEKQFTKRLPYFFHNHNYSYNERLKFLNLESLELRKLKFDIELTHKIIHGHLKLQSKDFFRINNSVTRSNGLKIQKY